MSTRMSSEERRASILDAAIAVFGAKGYDGATTDDVARAASVSQPYVVRLFGGKENLFLAAERAVIARLLDGFRRAAAEVEAAPERLTGEERRLALVRAMGAAYIRMLEVRGLHLTLQNGLMLGAHPVIGPVSRELFAEVWRFLRDEVGFDAEAAQLFLAQGMLVTTLVGLRVVDDYDSDPMVAELLAACFPEDLPSAMAAMPRGDDPW